MSSSPRSSIKHRVVLREITNFEYDFVFDSEFEIVSLSELLIFLDRQKSKMSNASKKQKKFKISCTLLDLYSLVKKYRLTKKFDYNTIEHCTYSDTQPSFPTDFNTYVHCKISMYGNHCFNLNIGGYYVQAIIDSKSKKYKQSFDLVESKTIDFKKLVILDMETTGLSEFEDDIIEIAFYDIETKDSFCKKLPLKKRNSIPESISELNHITDDMLVDSTPLTQKEVDQLIDRFNLEEKLLAIWTGNNLFDAAFLAIYFIDNGLAGFDKLSFLNVKSFIQQNKLLYSNDFSKDYIASKLGIPIESSHSALSDCLIEARILDKVLGLQKNNCDKSILADLTSSKITESNAKQFYERMINYCRDKNGLVLDDFDKDPCRRGGEWIDIHHIDETQLDNIATRTYEAQKDNDTKTLEELKEFNKASRLVYATKVEHFLLHYIIEYLRGPGGGPHWIFGDILRAQFHIKLSDYESDDFGYRLACFSDVSFDQITLLYKNILKKDHLTKEMVLPFYKLNTINEEVDQFLNNLFK